LFELYPEQKPYCLLKRISLQSNRYFIQWFFFQNDFFGGLFGLTELLLQLLYTTVPQRNLLRDSFGRCKIPAFENTSRECTCEVVISAKGISAENFHLMGISIGNKKKELTDNL
jgi:hypothetical protein